MEAAAETDAAYPVDLAVTAAVFCGFWFCSAAAETETADAEMIADAAEATAAALSSSCCLCAAADMDSANLQHKMGGC